jgi:tripartite-type tricarboxylate transporter receptor subunit TctC
VRQRPGIVNYGSSGDGSTGHLAGELFKSLTATNMVHVSFNGGVNALTGVQTGQVQLGFIALPLVLPYALQGKRTLLALTSAKRFSALPDLPTLAEAGMPGYHAEAWYGIFVPARTPRSTVETLNAAVVNSLKLPGTAALYRSHGVEAAGNAPEEFAAMIREELARWSQVIKVGLATPE